MSTELTKGALIKGVIIDSIHNIKGSVVWTPFGNTLCNNLFRVIKEAWEGLGYEEWLFPILNTKSNLDIEEEHIKGFSSEIFWLNDGVSFLSPTGESTIYTFLSQKRIKYPLRLYQDTKVFRNETNATRALWRSREFRFLEFHSFHRTNQEALEEVNLQVNRLITLFREILKIDPLIITRPPEETFPGAVTSIGFDVILPDGHISQVASIHFYSQNFSRAYKLTTPEGIPCFQTTFGISERLLGVLAYLHSKEGVLRLPLQINPEPLLVLYPPNLSREVVMSYLSSLTKSRFNITAVQLSIKQGFSRLKSRGSRILAFIGLKEIERNEVTILYPSEQILSLKGFSKVVNSIEDIELIENVEFINNPYILVKDYCENHLIEHLPLRLQGHLQLSIPLTCEVCNLQARRYLYGKKL